MAKEKPEIVTIGVDLLVDHPENPNVMSDGEFSKLADNIDDVGFAEPIAVAKNLDGTYTVISGHHRKRAAVINGLEELPSVIMADLAEGQPDWENKRLYQLVRMNIIKGKIDPWKFTEMYEKLSKDQDKELVKEMFGFADEAAFKELYREVKAQLPEELQEALEKSKKEIKNIDDLSRILNKLFGEYGDTLDHSYIFFDYGGKTHLQVQMNPTLHKYFKSLHKACQKTNVDINEYLVPVFERAYAEIEDTSEV